MRFLRRNDATASVEWLIVAAAIIGVIGAILLGIFFAIQDRLEAVLDSL